MHDNNEVDKMDGLVYMNIWAWFEIVLLSYSICELSNLIEEGRIYIINYIINI